MACAVMSEKSGVRSENPGTKSDSSAWAKTFPSDLTSFRNATLFIKKLLAVSISNIMYLRALFPENAFGCRFLGDLKIRILSENSSCSAACEVVNWVKGCFEALEHKYLRQIILGVHSDPDDHDNVIEAYTFRISYTDKGAVVSCNGEPLVFPNGYDTELTKRSTKQLLRTLVVVMGSLEKLPPNTYLSMKLLYYDEVTPPDYHPNGFVPAETDEIFFVGNPINIKAGEVSTPYHSVRVRIRVDKKQFQFPDDEPIPSESIKLQSSDEADLLLEQSQEENNECNMNDNVVDSNVEYVKGEHNIDSPGNESIHQAEGTKDKGGIEVTEDESCTIRCPCGSDDEEGLMIECMKCELWQHAICFGILEESAIPKHHICELCNQVDGSGIEPLDKDFYKLPLSDMQALCLWRRALISVCDLKIVQTSVLAKRLKINKSVAAKIIERMEDEDYVTPGSGKFRGRKQVNKTLIKSHGIPKYVKKSTKSFSCDKKNKSVDELNVKTKDLSMSDKPDVFTPYQLRERKRGKENQQVDEPGPSVSNTIRGRKRENEDLQNSEMNCSQETGYNNDQARRKRKKASICESGIALGET